MNHLRIPSINSYSSSSLSSLNTPLSETCDGFTLQSPLKWKPKCSPAVSLEDLLSSGSISPIVDYNGRVRKTVNQALDACIWLKSAGFPQYVQKFEAGEFPLNLSKLQVERDHGFLDGSAIDALIKRLNVLNRCADLLEEILEKNNNNVESDDEDDMRALSDHWHKLVGGRWSRRSAYEDGGDTTTDTDSEASHSPSLMVTDLSTSPTGTVKTYTFGNDTNQGHHGLPRATAINGTASPVRPVLTIQQSSMDKDEELLMGDNTNDLLGSFASGILDTFEASLALLQKGSSLSRSLPNVFSASLEVDSPNASNRYSSNVSLESTNNDEFLTEDDCLSPPIHSQDDTIEQEKGLAHEWTPKQNSCHSNNTGEDDTVSGSVTTEDTPSIHSTSSRRTTLEALEPESFHDVTSDQVPTKAKWHSFHRQHSFRRVFKPIRTLIPIEELSVGQMTILRKLSLIRLTALLDLYKAKINVSRILKIKKSKHIKNDKGVFGGSLLCNVKRYGTALPPVLIKAMNHLRMEGMETVGLFRRTAAKSSIESLKEDIELNHENVDFSQYTNYQVADAIKLFFRDLPEPLLTVKLSEALIACFEHIPEEVRLQALQAIILLLPDEHREALHCLLHFLRYISSHARIHQMDAKNLGLCLSPSLFALSSTPRPSLARRGSFRRNNAVSSPSALSATGAKELTEHMISSRCLTELIQRYEEMFGVPADMMQTCKFSHLEFGDPVSYHDIGKDKDGCGGYHSYIEECVAIVTKDQKKKFRGWVQCQAVKDISLAYCKIADGIPLKLWQASVDIPVSPKVLLRKLWDDRYMWDGNIVNARHIATLDPQTEVYQYVTSSIPPEAHRDHCIMRAWRYDPVNNTYCIVSTSVSHPNASLMGGVRCTELASRYLIEETNDGCSHLTYYYRVDLRGRSPEFYNHAFGHYLGSSLHTLRNSFKRSLELEYLETPV